jgi:subtilisin family serine protease
VTLRRAAGVVLVGCTLGALVAGTSATGATRTLTSTSPSQGAAAIAERSSGALVPNDPLVVQQWYLERIRAFDAWEFLPPLAPITVGVVDSGIDLGHPELAGRIVAAKSFVGGPSRDVKGHGTIVAGVIAAQPDNAVGIAGLAPSARLLIAKVVQDDGSIDVEAEAAAIRWVVDRGARVLNMSLGGVRDPRRPDRDTFSTEEAEAVAYAVRRGVLVVASVGNADQSPEEPWPYASYPAALPHVLGVSAVDRMGRSPSFSNRDRLFNDVAAPGVDILSLFPRALTAKRASCVDQGTTMCATAGWRRPEGTSFAAPLVAGVAANLLALRPELRPEQVAAFIQRTANDARPLTGCRSCAPGRDPQTGWGELDATAAYEALDGELPPRDAHEPNDDAGAGAYRLFFPPGRQARGVTASLDFWDDQDDVYAVFLRRGERLFASLGAAKGSTVLAVWSPETESVDDLGRQDLRLRVSSSVRATDRVAWTATETGWHYLQARIVEPGGPIPYRLSVVRAPSR